MTKNFLIGVPLLLLLIVNWSFAQVTQPRTAAIEGSIIFPNNQAMERYDILLLSKDGEQVISHTYTDLSGRYRFGGLTADNFDVVIRIDGFDEARVPVKLSPNRVMSVNIMMTPKASTVVVPDQWDPAVVNVAELTRKFSRKSVEDFQKALESKRKGDVARSMELLEGVVKLSPDFFEAHNLLGTVYQGMERFREAEKQYNLSRNLSPASVEPLADLATLYLQEAEANEKEGPFVTGVMYDDALHILQDAAKLDPHNATVFFLVGVTFYRTHSYRIAEASFKEALIIDARMGTARLALANVYIREQKWKEALNEFDSYLAEHPKADDRSLVEAVRIKVIQQL